MKYISLLAITIFLFATGRAQTGRLTVQISYWDRDTLGYKAVLLKNDSAITEKELPYDDYNTYFDSLVPGRYGIKFYSGKELLQYHRNLEVINGKETNLNLDLSPDISDIDRNDSITSREYALLHFSYSPKILETDTAYPIEHLLSFGYRQQFLGKITRNFYMGVDMGSSISFGIFDTARTMMPPANHTTERMFQWTYTVGLLNRFTFYNNQREGAKGLFIDLGAGYNFPIMFRHVVINGPQKIVDRHIHKFRDFSAIARIGYGIFTLQAEYKLTEYVKGDYPEMPQLLLGIALTVPTTSQ